MLCIQRMNPETGVRIEIASPRHFERGQLAVRIVLACVLGWFGITFGSLAALGYLVLPILAASAITSVGGDNYLGKLGRQLGRALTWVLRCEAYMMLLVDRLPIEDDPGVSITIGYGGHPTLRSAMWRLVTSLPLAAVALVLAIPSAMLWFVAALWILFGFAMPRPILAFQLGVLRWQAQLLVYQGSLVGSYPWSFDTTSHLAAAAA